MDWTSLVASVSCLLLLTWPVHANPYMGQQGFQGSFKGPGGTNFVGSFSPQTGYTGSINSPSVQASGVYDNSGLAQGSYSDGQFGRFGSYAPNARPYWYNLPGYGGGRSNQGMFGSNFGNMFGSPNRQMGGGPNFQLPPVPNFAQSFGGPGSGMGGPWGGQGGGMNRGGRGGGMGLGQGGGRMNRGGQGFGGPGGGFDLQSLFGGLWGGQGGGMNRGGPGSGMGFGGPWGGPGGGGMNRGGQGFGGQGGGFDLQSLFGGQWGGQGYGQGGSADSFMSGLQNLLPNLQAQGPVYPLSLNQLPGGGFEGKFATDAGIYTGVQYGNGAYQGSFTPHGSGPMY